MTLQEPTTDILEEAIRLISKTVKCDLVLVQQILFNGLSCFTPKPAQLMIMERTSEGKTYPALEISQHFPPSCVLSLGSASPQSFKYDVSGILVDSNYNPIEERLEKLTKDMLEAKKHSKDSKYKGRTEQELETERTQVLKDQKTLIDLRGKWIIFKEPPDPRLLEALYSTLSHDAEYNEHRFVNKIKNKNQNFIVVFRGSPAILICTAKDETKHARYSETLSRVNVVSPQSSSEKYLQGMELIAQKNGLPKKLYEKFVISDAEKNRLKELISKLIKRVQSSDEVFNPFSDKVHKLFPKDTGLRWRQFQRFLVLCNLHCLCYVDQRPSLLMEGKKIPVVTKADIMWANGMMKDNDFLPPHKLTWFHEVFLPAYEKLSQPIDFQDGTKRSVIIASTISQYCNISEKGKATAKQVRETYLDTLYENGVLEKDKDPRNRTREVYWPTEGYEQISKSSLVDVSLLDESCVTSCLNKYLEQRFKFEIKGTVLDQNDMVPYILSTKNVI